MTKPGWPFLGSEAVAGGSVGPRALRSRNVRIYRDVYLPKDVTLSAEKRAIAAWLWTDRQATLGGLSAAALYGTKWIDAQLPAEVFRRNGKPVDGILVHRDELFDDETTSVRGISATTPARTAFDLGVRGLVQLRDAVAVMDGGAESPPETRTRLVLLDAGLPKPQTQIWVGRYRVDMGYEEFRVGVEYDGEQHWTDPRIRAYDIDRHAELLAHGWVIIRVSAEMLRCRPRVIVLRTCAALRKAGAEWPGGTSRLRGIIARIQGLDVA